MNRLSLCMIVKNEQEMLPACLASVRGVVDEMIIVDTGSVDRTKEIALAAGAKVVDFAWCDDFAAARNAALPHVTGQWILVLDADERLVARDAGEIRRAIQDPSLDLGLLPLHSASRVDARDEEVLSGEARRGEAVLLPRLLRRTPDLFWDGVVHEHVAHWIAKRVERCRGVAASIVHLGAVPSVREARAKSERNIQLLRRRAQLEPQNPLPYTFLSQEYRNVQRIEEADLAIAQAWRMLCRLAPIQNPKPQIVDTATLMAHVCIEKHDPAAALQVLDLAFSWHANHPNLWFLLGLAHQLEASQATNQADRRAAYLRAIDAHQKCVSMDGRAFPEEMLAGITGATGWFHLGNILLQLGELGDAEAVFSTAVKNYPNEKRLAIGRALVHIEQGNALSALSAMEPLMAQGVCDAWAIAAAAAESLGQYEDAAFFLKQVRGEAIVPLSLGLATSVERTLSLISGKPIGGLDVAGRLNALITRKALPRGFETANAYSRARVAHTVRLLAKRGDGAAIETLLEPRAEQALPGIHDVVKSTLAEMGINAEEDSEPELLVIGGPYARGLLAALSKHPRLVDVERSNLIGAAADDSRTRRIPGREDLLARIFAVGKRGRAIVVANEPLSVWRAAFPHCRAITVGESSNDPMTRSFPANAIEQPEQLLRDALAFIGEVWTDRVLGSFSPHLNGMTTKVLNSPQPPPNRSAEPVAGGLR